MANPRQNRSADLLVGMKAICNYLGISAPTALKWERELGLPIRKTDRDGAAGIWVGSRKKIEDWSQSLVD